MKKPIGPIVLAAVVATGAALLQAPAALAKDGDVRVAGRCSGPTTSKLKLSPEDGAIEVELEVDQNRNGVRWNVVLFRGGQRVAGRVGVTRGPSGSFEARFVTANRAGADSLTARATRAAEVCTARATIA